jgi:hypothetical protein
MYINMNDGEYLLPPAGPEAEESPLRLLEDIGWLYRSILIYF